MTHPSCAGLWHVVVFSLSFTKEHKIMPQTTKLVALCIIWSPPKHLPLWLIASIVYIITHQSCTWRSLHLGSQSSWLLHMRLSRQLSPAGLWSSLAGPRTVLRLLLQHLTPASISQSGWPWLGSRWVSLTLRRIASPPTRPVRSAAWLLATSHIWLVCVGGGSSAGSRPVE